MLMKIHDTLLAITAILALILMIILLSVMAYLAITPTMEILGI